MGRLLEIARERRAIGLAFPAPVKVDRPTATLPDTDPPAQRLVAHVKPIEQWDDCDRAANAVFRGEALPTGWACITGAQLIAAIEANRETLKNT